MGEAVCRAVDAVWVEQTLALALGLAEGIGGLAGRLPQTPLGSMASQPRALVVVQIAGERLLGRRGLQKVAGEAGGLWFKPVRSGRAA